MKVSDVATMRAMDKAAIEQFGIPEDLLMENAGLAAFRALTHALDVRGQSILIFCGPGANGGDGLVVARLIHAAGGLAQVILLADPVRYVGASARNFAIVERLGIPMQQLTAEDDIDALLRGCDAVIDALLGTGISRAVSGLYAQVIDAINRSGKLVLSIDIPSGVNGDTGQIMGSAVRADLTATFGLPKIGNLLYPGFELGGRLFVSYISFPPELTTDDELDISVNAPVELPKREVAGHKGSFGQALFIAGAATYYGAPILAARAYLKAGGGYSRLAAPRAMIPTLATIGSEVVFVPQAETDFGSIALSNKSALLALIEKMDFVVLGPGLSLDDETQQLARELAAEIEKPLLLDGDGITALCADLDILRTRAAPTILTPHLGEMARLTGLSTAEIDADRIAALQETVADLGCFIVLKGAHSLIGAPDRRVFINMNGNSGMATAGSGDVLAGTIAAMFGLGLSVEKAARMAVFVHGLAGDLAAESIGADGLTASDILEHLPQAVRAMREGLDRAREIRYSGAELIE